MSEQNHEQPDAANNAQQIVLTPVKKEASSKGSWRSPEDEARREKLNRLFGLDNTAGSSYAEWAMAYLDSFLETWWQEADALDRLEQLINERRETNGHKRESQ